VVVLLEFIRQAKRRQAIGKSRVSLPITYQTAANVTQLPYPHNRHNALPFAGPIAPVRSFRMLILSRIRGKHAIFGQIPDFSACIFGP
jgi:hypothetical protein